MGKRAEQNRHYLCKYFMFWEGIHGLPGLGLTTFRPLILAFGEGVAIIDVSIMLHDRA